MDTVKFYKGQIRSLSGYWLQEIWRWDKVTLEKKHDYIQSLFPLFISGTADAYLLTPQAIEAFKTDSELQQNVLRSLMLMLNFYGFTINNNAIYRIAPIHQIVDDVTVGLYSTHNYLRITRILRFLRLIGQHYWAQELFSAICQDLHNDPVLYNTVKELGSLEIWTKIMESRYN